MMVNVSICLGRSTKIFGSNIVLEVSVKVFSR